MSSAQASSPTAECQRLLDNEEPGIMDLTALHDAVFAEHLFNGAAQPRTTVDDDKQRAVRGHSALDKIREQRAAQRRVLRRALADRERMLLAA
jgi:hypothetical protein